MNILEVKNVSKTYGKHKVLNNISLNIPEGKIYGLLGPNGAGKTTLIRIINQIIVCDEGEILFKGLPITRQNIEKLGYLPEERGLYTKMKVGEHLVYMARLKGIGNNSATRVVKTFMKEFDILDWWNKRVEQLSKGMQQKVQFIISILNSPEFVILDEPFTGFDPVNAEFIKQKILELKKKGVTFMLSTHRMETVEELCDYVTLIHQSNKIIDGEKHKIKSQFRTSKYEVICDKSELLQKVTSNVYQIESIEPDENPAQCRLILCLNPGKKSNDLLKEIAELTEIHSFKEIIPDMNEIFIKLVNQTKNE